MNRILPYPISLLALLLTLATTACTSGGNAEGPITPPIAGATKPKDPVIVREPVKVNPQSNRESLVVTADFDFNWVVNGKTPLGKQSWLCTITKQDKNKITMTGPKQEAMSLAYRLDSLHPTLNLPAGVQQLQVDANIEVMQGALTKSITLSQQGQTLHMALLNGASMVPLQASLPGGIAIVQQAMDPKPVRTDAEAAYHTVPVKVSGPGMNFVLRPGTEKVAGGLTVRLIESEKRMLDTASRTAAANVEGPAYHYHIALWR